MREQLSNKNNGTKNNANIQKYINIITSFTLIGRGMFEWISLFTGVFKNLSANPCSLIRDVVSLMRVLKGDTFENPTKLYGRIAMQEGRENTL